MLRTLGEVTVNLGVNVLHKAFLWIPVTLFFFFKIFFDVDHLFILFYLFIFLILFYF